MAEQFNMVIQTDAGAKEVKREINRDTKISVDVSTDFIDLYIGKKHIRWDRHDGRVI